MRRIIISLIIFTAVFIVPSVYGQTVYADPLAHTYSIVAWDEKTGDMGVAVQSHWFSVGSLVSWAEAGAGAVATQSFVNPSFGPRGLALLKQGKTAQQVVDELIDSDPGRNVRQLAIVDSRGNAAVYTGSGCIAEAGHYAGEHFTVQANMMLKNTVWTAMAEAYKSSYEKPLAERLVAALEAAQDQGGDIRGKQSAAIIVVRGHSTGKVWEDRLIDLRVDDDEQPVQELKRLLLLHRAYEHMNAGDLAVENNDADTALREYAAAESMFPENLEMKFWHAVSLANMGRVVQSIPFFRQAFEKDPNWMELLKRLPAAGLLSVNEDDMKKITRLQ